uniref:FxsA family protein n=1 Tax=Pararhizobium sp. IMCC3301 TaxID=3067904 RepID=UPI002742607C|nr:FxsA family protein [Pararhizobium sp. IMCC3301]
MRFSLIPFALLIVPLLEITAFVVIGGEIGVWATLALVVVTAVIGSFLLRWQGISLLRRIRTDLAAKRLPAKELVRGAMLVVAGILLLTPGFVTDTLGFLLFVPPVQETVWRFLKSRIQLVGAAASSGSATRQNSNAPGGPSQAGESVVELDAKEFRRNDPDSPWVGGPEDDSRR